MKFLFLIPAVLFFISCNKRQSVQEKGTPASGQFTLYADGAYLPLLRVLTDGYMSVYPQVVITIDTASNGGSAYSRLADSKIRAAVTGFKLSSNDSLAFSQRKIYPQVFHFATDALVYIISAGDTSVQYKFISLECPEKSIQPSIKHFVTDKAGSENNRFLRELASANCSQNQFSAENQDAVINRITTHPGEAGIIGWSYLCEKKNPEIKRLRSLLKIIPFQSNDTTLVDPSQSALMTGSYPLARKLYLVTAEPFAGPATGFASYVASDEGQRIIRLFGLAPYKTPPREIYVN